jgi:hypothetical protein
MRRARHGALWRARRPPTSISTAAAAGPHNVGLRHDGRNVEPVEQM